MSHLSTRTVKGIKYFYLEESFKINGKWQKESVYLGPDRPTPVELISAFETLKKKCKTKKHEVLVQPLTEFISNKTAKKLQQAVENKKTLFKKLSGKQREEFIKRERITFITDSNAIEGSSLGYTETEQILAQEKQIKKYEKQKIIVTGMGREEQEALNLKACLDRYDQYRKINAKLSEKMILQLHYILLEKIEGYEKYQGVYRPVQVYVRGSTHEFPLPQELPGLMKKLVEWFEENGQFIHP